VNEVKKKAAKDDGKAVEMALKEICTELGRKAESGIKVSVGPFIFWRSFEDSLKRTCNDVWKTLENEFKTLLFLPKQSNLRLADDGVHLQEKSASKYIESLVEGSLVKWLSESSDSEMDSEDAGNNDTIIATPASTPVPQHSRATFREANDSSRITQLRGEFRSFKRSVEDRLEQDLLLFAKHEEAIDSAKNERNLDKVLFSGVYIEALEGSMDTKIPLMKTAVNNILASFMDLPTDDEGSKVYPRIVFISHLNPQVKSNWRVIEARFESKDVANRIRETFGKKRKEMRVSGVIAEGLKGVGINLSLTKETKVRIEVMKALAKIINSNTTAEVNSFVLQYMPKPMLKIAIKKSETVTYTRVYSYTDSIEYVRQAGYPIHDQDLIEAYSKAGNMKNLEHKFVLLKSSNFAREYLSDGDDGRRNKRPKK